MVELDGRDDRSSTGRSRRRSAMSLWQIVPPELTRTVATCGPDGPYPKSNFDGASTGPKAPESGVLSTSAASQSTESPPSSVYVCSAPMTGATQCFNVKVRLGAMNAPLQVPPHETIRGDCMRRAARNHPAPFIATSLRRVRPMYPRCVSRPSKDSTRRRTWLFAADVRRNGSFEGRKESG